MCSSPSSPVASTASSPNPCGDTNAPQARQLFRRFLDTTARVTIAEHEVTVHLPRRAHNPILLDAGLIGAPAAIPWWGGRRLRLEIV